MDAEGNEKSGLQIPAAEILQPCDQVSSSSMDPLSITASIIAILGAVKATTKGISRIRQAVHGVEILLSLNNELVDVTLVLTEIEAACNGNNLPPDNLSAVLEVLSRVKPVVEASRDFIEEGGRIVDEITSTKKDKTLYAIRQRKEILRHQECVRKAKVELSVTLNVIMAAYSRKGFVALRRIMTMQEIISEKIDSRPTLSAPIGTSNILPTTASGKSGNLAFEMSAALATCATHCLCACHKPLLLRTSNVVAKTIGFLFLGLTAVPCFRPRCDVSACPGNAATSLKLTYYFPHWFVSRALRFVYQTSLGGPELIIRLPRIVEDDHTTLHLSAWGNAKSLAEELNHKSLAPTDVSGHSGWTGLHHAASRGFTDVAKILLHCGADPYFESQANESPYDIAWTNILSQAWPQDTVEAFRSMFSDPAYLENRQFSLLHKIVLGILTIDLDTMDRARVRSDINRRDKAGKTPLSWAASRKDAAKVRYLLQNGADPNISSLDGRTPMHAAALANDNASVQMLCRYGAVIDASDGNAKTPLQVAASYNGTVELLLDLGAEIERSDIHRRTALLHATSRGHTEVVRILVDRGANVSAVERNGCSSFHHAVTGNFHDILSLLLATSPSAANSVAYGANDQTILHIAARYADTATVELLSRTKLDRSLSTRRTADGLTPLAMASTHRNIPYDQQWQNKFEDLLEMLDGDDAEFYDCVEN